MLSTPVKFGESKGRILCWLTACEGAREDPYVPNTACFFALLHVRASFLCALCECTCCLTSGWTHCATVIPVRWGEVGPTSLLPGRFCPSGCTDQMCKSLFSTLFFSRSLPSARAVMCHLLACMRRAAPQPLSCVLCLVWACLILSAGPQVGLLHPCTWATINPCGPAPLHPLKTNERIISAADLHHQTTSICVCVF